MQWNTAPVFDADFTELLSSSSGSVAVDIARPTNAIVFLGSTLASTGTSRHDNGDRDLAVGESATVRTSFVLPQGTYPLSIRMDTSRPSRSFAFTAAFVETLGSAVSTTSGLIIGSNATLTPALDAVVFDFGIVNVDAGLANPPLAAVTISLLLNAVIDESAGAPGSVDGYDTRIRSRVTFGHSSTVVGVLQQFDVVEADLAVTTVNSSDVTLIDAGD